MESAEIKVLVLSAYSNHKHNSAYIMKPILLFVYDVSHYINTRSQKNEKLTTHFVNLLPLSKFGT